MKEWPAVEEKGFDTIEEKYVVCIDTLGQDRELTDDQKRLILATVKNFKDVWERTEKENLTRDRNRKLEIMEIDKEFLDNEAQKLLDEEEKHIEELHSAMREGDAVVDDELKELQTKQARLHFIAKLYGEREDWKKNLYHIKEFKVLKIPRVLQSIFYLLHYERENICEKGTNKFFWKKAKHLVNDHFIHKLTEYRVLGPKDEHFMRY